jgi:hypothetical protein
MRNAMRDAPAKWAYVLGDLDVVITMCDSIWTGQLDRHGTDDAAVPLSVSHEQADAAFHVALALVRLFSAGLVRRVDP